MSIRALALDLDGTLLNPYNELESDTVRCLTHLRKKGLLLFIATGRTVNEMAHILPHLDVDGVVAANGMLTYSGEKILQQHHVPHSLVKQVTREARKANIYYEIHPHTAARYALIHDKGYMEQEISGAKPSSVEDNEWRSRIFAMKKEIAWAESIQNNDAVMKLYFFSKEKQRMIQWKETLEKMRESSPFAAFSSSEHNVEIMAAGVSKATGLRVLLDSCQINSTELLAVGDSENDLPMFQLAGHAAAMANASDLVKSHTKETTRLSYAENGLYYYLKDKFSSIMSEYK